MRDRKLLGGEMGRISVEQYTLVRPSGIVAVLDNVRSAHNVGSVFRTCDAFHIDKVFLCGICACPPSAELHKTALGAEMSVPWSHCGDTLELVRSLKADGYTVIAVEQTEHSVNLDDVVLENEGKYAFVFGNEVSGVDQAVVDEADFSLEIPQWGTKHSLNVSVCAGVILWEAAKRRHP